jgi:hypothetical protein
MGAVFVLVCVAVAFLAARAIFPKREPTPTISWGTLAPATGVGTPTAPPSPTTECLPDAEYVGDVTIPDGTALAPGESFLKAWRVRNSGTCPWLGDYALSYISGDQMGGASSVAIPAAQPGESTELSVPLVAPSEPGTYRGNWQLCIDRTACFGPSLYVQIGVQVDATPSTTATLEAAAPTSAPETAPSPPPSASPLPPNPGSSEWLIAGSRALGVREIAWDTALNGYASAEGEIYLSLYIIGIPTGGSSTVFSPLEITLVDGDAEQHETLILERKDPPFALCTAGPGSTCEGWWTTTIQDRNRTRRSLILRWEPSLLSPPLETPIWQ